MRLLLAGIARLRIAWRLDDGDEFYLEIPFRGALFGRKVLEEVARDRRKRPEELRLEQWRAVRKSDGAVVVDVVGEV